MNKEYYKKYENSGKKITLIGAYFDFETRRLRATRNTHSPPINGNFIIVNKLPLDYFVTKKSYSLDEKKGLLF